MNEAFGVWRAQHFLLLSRLQWMKEPANERLICCVSGPSQRIVGVQRWPRAPQEPSCNQVTKNCSCFLDLCQQGALQGIQLLMSEGIFVMICDITSSVIAFTIS